MADPSSSADCPVSTIELNIKTLESQIHRFQVDTKMTVLAFKEKISQEIGVPVAQQRLIFRGRVLKDEHSLSEYQVENGHTLHLVSRQSTQSQSSTDAGSTDANANNSNQSRDAGSGAGNNRMGQISHSVLLGTFNVADQGEGIMSDANRVIGAVLNSLGLSGLASGGFGAMPSSNMSHATTQASQVNETGESGNNAGGTGPTGNQTQSGIAPSGQSVQPPPRSIQISRNAAATPLPSLLAPVPDSLSTLSEFMTHMERALAQNGYQPNSSTNGGDILRPELPSNSLGLPTVEALGFVLRHAERLLSGHAIAALSHIAGRLEQEGATSDPTIRGHIQSESVQIGLAMQHLGALLLELGRTILTLRMGQSPVQSSVNAGPAVYISPSGPNPIMVQPFPLQTNSLFGGSVPPLNPMNFGPVGVGNAPRHVNIHIHTGTALAPVVSTLGARAGNGETPSAGRNNGTNLGSGPARVIPLGNLMAAPMPLHSTTGVVNTPLSVSSSSVPQNLLASESTRSMVDDINAHIRNLVRNRQVEAQPTQGGVASSSGGDSISQQTNCAAEAQESNEPLHEAALLQRDQKAQSELELSTINEALESVSSSKNKSSEDTSFIPEKAGEDPPSSSALSDIVDGPRAAPLGLGLGNLERMKRVRQPKSSGSSSSTGDAAGNRNIDSLSGGQQIIRSLAARGSNDLGANSTVSGSVPTSRSMEQLGSDNQLGAASVMSEVLQSPDLDGLLAGVSEQTGMGSPNILRNMLQQLSQNPQIMSTVGQIAQQVDSQSLENMFSGLGSGQGGGIDLSRMLQSMMPVVSQVLGSGSISPLMFPTLGAENQIQSNETSMGCPENLFDDTQIDLQEVSQSIEQMGAPANVFGAVVRSAVRLNDGGSSPEEIVQELSNDDDLVRDYMELLRHDIQQRAQRDLQPDNC